MRERSGGGNSNSAGERICGFCGDSAEAVLCGRLLPRWEGVSGRHGRGSFSDADGEDTESGCRKSS